MNGQQVFDEYLRVSQIGERLDSSKLEAPVAEVYTRPLEYLRSIVNSAYSSLPGLASIYCDFVSNPEFNARAVRFRDMHLIVIFYGMPVVTSLVVRRLLADQILFCQVGNAVREAKNLPLFSEIIPNARTMLKTNKLVTPVDEQRLIYCFYLQKLIFEFIAAHELTHVVHGHVAYEGSKRGTNMIEEFGWKCSTPSDNIESQTMEMDADFNAARLFMQNIDRLWKVHRTLAPPLNNFYSDRIGAVYHASVAICIICRMFGDSAISGVDLGNSTHPPMSWRQMWILNTLGNYVRHLWGDELVSSAEKSIRRAVEDVEYGFETITGRERSINALRDALGPVGQAHAKLLTDCWNRSLRANLGRYSYIAEMPHYGFDFPTSTE